ncbi:hypothetical protein VNO78_20089 [Psophocarpus tetragonolobus]|uniref:Uncharacterized protein n=1 Tax=Psophocarpus tetragonolobus TaxID=3891 RepID=A0AAN9SAN8_PSOTE
MLCCTTWTLLKFFVTANNEELTLNTLTLSYLFSICMLLLSLYSATSNLRLRIESHIAMIRMVDSTEKYQSLWTQSNFRDFHDLKQLGLGIYLLNLLIGSLSSKSLFDLFINSNKRSQPIPRNPCNSNVSDEQECSNMCHLWQVAMFRRVSSSASNNVVASFVSLLLLYKRLLLHDRRLELRAWIW